MKKILSFIFKHKIISLIILVVVGGGYYWYQSTHTTQAETRYVLGSVEKGTIVASVSGSGQLSASNQVDVKTKSSGEVTSVNVTVGQEVKAGALLARLDASDALKAVRDAQTSLETAKLELDEILKPVDELTLMQSENSLQQAKDSKQDAEDNLKKSYEDGFNNVANTFLNLPAVMAGLKDILYGYDYVNNQQNVDYYANVAQTYDENAVFYKNDAITKYEKARASYDQNFTDYKATSRYSDTAVIENLINESYETTKVIAEAVKSANNLIRFYEDTILDYNTRPQTLADTHLTSLDGYTSKTNSYLTSLLSSADSIKNYKDSITSADRSIKEKELSLAKLQDTDELSIRAKKIAVQQKEDALTTAKETLVDCSVYAPFAGVVAKVSLKKGDTASSGATVATLVTKQNIAEVSLNEVDAAKVKVGNKATLTFDAVSDLSITGTVAEVDSLGTVSQGVVTYTIKINFDTQDDRIKPGMSVSASIITDSQQDVLTVPNAAVKTSGNTSYVEIPDETVSSQSSDTINGVLLTKTPKQQVVEIGLANDTMTEIKSGLIEGDTVIIRTVTTNGTSSTNTSSSRSILQSGGVRTSGGGNVMMIPRD